MSDVAKVHNVVWGVDDDGSGYIVFRTGVHKTAQTAKRKRVLLPIIVPLRGVHGNAFGSCGKLLKTSAVHPEAMQALPADHRVRWGVL